jgi:hypothetical protein
MDIPIASRVFKVLAMLVALLMITYGSFMVFLGGWGEPGPAPVPWRLLGCFVLLEGFLYLLPNSLLRKYWLLSILYLVTTSLPILGLGIAAVVTVISNGFMFLLREALIAILLMTVAFSFAPISLLLSWRSQYQGG